MIVRKEERRHQWNSDFFVFSFFFSRYKTEENRGDYGKVNRLLGDDHKQERPSKQL